MKFGPLPIPYPVYEGEDDKGGTPPGEKSLMDKGGGDKEKDISSEKQWWDDPKVFTPETDAEILTEVKRYKSPVDAIKSLVETKKMVRSAPKDDPMPEVGDGKDETKVTARKEWNKRHGIPDDPTGYKISESVTKRLVETDKPLIENFTTVAHKMGQPQSVVDFATNWYVDAMEQEALREAENDKKDGATAEDALREEWTSNYRGNMDFAISTAKNILGEKYGGASIFDARLPNGMKLGSIPEFVQGMHKAGLAIYGDGSLVGDEAVKASGARKAEIQQIMKTNFDEYISKGLDKEYDQILAAEDRANQNKRV